MLYSFQDSAFLAAAVLKTDSAIEEGQISDQISESMDSSFAEGPHTTGKKLIYRFKVHQEIAPAASRLVERAVSQAEEMNADYILLDLDTYGGLVDAADEIRTRLLRTEVTTLAYINNNAASAGALISIACDSIYMTTGSTIGAATVVNQTGEQMPDKYQSYMRNKMRATAEATGRDPDIAEAMVDSDKEIDSLSDSGKVVTFTVDDAIKNNYCNGKTDSHEEVIDLLNIEDYEIVDHEVSKVENIIAFLLNPAVSGVLMLLIMGGLYFELQTPGVGFPLAAAITGAILYFAPHYLEGMAEHWEIIVFLVGILLIVVELFVIPGFGVIGISGIVVVVGALTLALVRNIVFDFSFVPDEELVLAFVTVVASLTAAVALMFAFGGSFFNSAAFRRLTLETVESKQTGYSIHNLDAEDYSGEIAQAVTDLRPAGKIKIKNRRLDAQTDSEYVEKGEQVRVIKAHGAYWLVEKLRNG